MLLGRVLLHHARVTSFGRRSDATASLRRVQRVLQNETVHVAVHDSALGLLKVDVVFARRQEISRQRVLFIIRTSCLQLLRHNELGLLDW